MAEHTFSMVVKTSEMKALEILLRCHHCSCSIHLVFLVILFGHKNPLSLPLCVWYGEGTQYDNVERNLGMKTAFIHAFLEEPFLTPPQTRLDALVRFLWFLIFSCGVLLVTTCQGLGTAGGHLQNEEACLLSLCPRAGDSVWHRADYQCLFKEQIHEQWHVLGCN